VLRARSMPVATPAEHDHQRVGRPESTQWTTSSARRLAALSE
jgi:hypothetical protein